MNDDLVRILRPEFQDDEEAQKAALRHLHRIHGDTRPWTHVFCYPGSLGEYDVFHILRTFDYAPPELLKGLNKFGDWLFSGQGVGEKKSYQTKLLLWGLWEEDLFVQDPPSREEALERWGMHSSMVPEIKRQCQITSGYLSDREAYLEVLDTDTGSCELRYGFYSNWGGTEWRRRAADKVIKGLDAWKAALEAW